MVSRIAGLADPLREGPIESASTSTGPAIRFGRTVTMSSDVLVASEAIEIWVS